MFGNPFNPYWWGPGPVIPNRPQIRRLDTCGIFELSTNAVQVTEESVDYGVNPICYNSLPCECIVLLKVHADPPTGGGALPVNVVTPSGGNTTLPNSGSSSGTTKIPVVDSNNNPVTGGDVTGITERLAYINKRTGVIRFLEFTSGGGATPTAAARSK